MQPGLGAQHHVLVHGQAGAESDTLERAGDAQLGQVVRVMPAEPASPVGQAAAPRVDEPADDVEQGRLAGAVRPDDAHHLATADPHRHLVERQEATETDTDLVDDQDGRLGRIARVGDRGLEGRARHALHRGAVGGMHRRPAPSDRRSYHQPPSIARDVTTS